MPAIAPLTQPLLGAGCFSGPLPASLGPGGSCWVFVDFTPTVAGTFTGTLEIDGSGFNMLFVSLSGTGT
jgi:hypothetical protein